jgi:hypothetical protein
MTLNLCGSTLSSDPVKVFFLATDHFHMKVEVQIMKRKPFGFRHSGFGFRLRPHESRNSNNEAKAFQIRQDFGF